MRTYYKLYGISGISDYPANNENDRRQKKLQCNCKIKCVHHFQKT